MADQPSQELPSVAPELFEKARAAVAAVRGQGRRADGTAGEGNTLALRHGLHSEQLLNLPDVGAWHREQVAAITNDLGGEAELSAMQRAAVREAARVEVILASLGDELLARGVLTGKGRARSSATLYLQTLDRWVRMATTIGLERRQKRVDVARAFAEHGRG